MLTVGLLKQLLNQYDDSTYVTIEGSDISGFTNLEKSFTIDNHCESTDPMVENSEYVTKSILNLEGVYSFLHTIELACYKAYAHQTPLNCTSLIKCIEGKDHAFLPKITEKFNYIDDSIKSVIVCKIQDNYEIVNKALRDYVISEGLEGYNLKNTFAKILM